MTFFLKTLKASFHDFSTADQDITGDLSLLYYGIAFQSEIKLDFATIRVRIHVNNIFKTWCAKYFILAVISITKEIINNESFL